LAARNGYGPLSFQHLEDSAMIRLPKWFVMVLALAMVIGLTSAVFAADTAKGKIKSVTADKKEFVVTDKNDKDWTFHMDDKGKITLADKEVKLDELKKGDEVEVKYEKDGEKLIAKEIKVERK
jgi:Cu/Ag efflux protein CusF